MFWEVGSEEVCTFLRAGDPQPPTSSLIFSASGVGPEGAVLRPGHCVVQGEGLGPEQLQSLTQCLGPGAPLSLPRPGLPSLHLWRSRYRRRAGRSRHCGPISPHLCLLPILNPSTPLNEWAFIHVGWGGQRRSLGRRGAGGSLSGPDAPPPRLVAGWGGGLSPGTGIPSGEPEVWTGMDDL